MTTPQPQVRRATIEDLPKLIPLWKDEGLATDDLARRLAEFQVVEAAGAVVGVLGIQLAAGQARLHSEAFADPAQADTLRDKLWERAQIIAKNHGLVRVWTQLATPFWHQNGFRHPAPEVADKLPRGFAGAPQPWLYVQLREESEIPLSADKEFALFKEMEHERTERLFRQARAMKLVAAVVVMIVFLLMVVWAVAWIKTQGVRNR